jgi:hypothetical protein
MTRLRNGQGFHRLLTLYLLSNRIGLCSAGVDLWDARELGGDSSSRAWKRGWERIRPLVRKSSPASVETANR